MANYEVAQLDQIRAVRCPCGMTRRAFVGSNAAASLHVVDIGADSTAHYHKRITELYYVLEGEGHIECDGERVPARPGTALLIKPGCRHRAVGTMKVLNVPIPPFDPRDEYFD